MKEANIQTLFGKNIENIINLLKKDGESNFVFELKISKSKSFLFSKVKEHQLRGLSSSRAGFYHKISDSPIFSGMKSRFTSQKAFDCLYMSNANGYIVICWYEKAIKKELHFIPVEVFINEREASDKKSLIYNRSLEISTLVYNLNKRSS